MAKILIVDDIESDTSFTITYWLSMCGSSVLFDVVDNTRTDSTSVMDIDETSPLYLKVLKILSSHFNQMCGENRISYQKYQKLCNEMILSIKNKNMTFR